MAGLIAKSVYGAAKVATKYVVIPIVYTALLGYLMQQAADALRDADSKHADSERAMDPELQPMP